MNESLTYNTFYHQNLINSINIDLFKVEAEAIEFNEQFKLQKDWYSCYLGPATAEFHGFNHNAQPAIRDENRNAIIPKNFIEIGKRILYLSIKGCGAYEDMFFGGKLNPIKIKNACQDKKYIKNIGTLSTGLGFIMGESWMGESPYGAQGFINGFDELNFSRIAKLDCINGAYICPAVAVIKLPKDIENTARKFFWFRTYEDHFYQVLRLVPSNVRLYFESSNVIANPDSIFRLFEIDTIEKVEKFELNFIKTGIALLTLYTRSAIIEGNDIKGIYYQDVWLDKDCVVAPDGKIHFADIEGFIWKKVSMDEYEKTQKKEWDKLVYEFLYALVQIDSYRHLLQERQIHWPRQREELALVIYEALNKDFFTTVENKNENLTIIVGGKDLPSVEIPILEKVDQI
ncbi:MAG: hypothetical protein ACFE9J_05475 [Candidatus Hermodarchaeota archaeon]